MGKRKITCNNSSCKHHTNGGCDTCITLDGSGKCKSFEKGFAYYFHIVWDALDNKNFIDMVEIRMNPDLKTGLFYVMECYDLGFSEMEWGTCRMVMLKDGKEGKPLKYEEIIEREMNMENLSEVKGYCLIHNPSGYTGYIVTNMKNLTKQQKEFLYGYFMDMGDRFKAEQFVDFD